MRGVDLAQYGLACVSQDPVSASVHCKSYEYKKNIQLPFQPWLVLPRAMVCAIMNLSILNC